MTEINISLNELDITLAKLWEKCDEEDCCFKAYPKTGTIEVYTTMLAERKLIAVINVVNITDFYDVISAIFN